MTTYFLTIADVENDEFVSQAYGEFPEMNFVAKAGLKRIAGKTGDFSARIVEVERVGDEDAKRTVTSITGDAETVAVVVKKKIATERKQYLAETGDTGETGDASADSAE